LPGSNVADTDRSLTSEEVAALCRDCEIVVQEKLDGTCVGVFFEEDESAVLLKRGGVIGHREKDQYNVFRSWVQERTASLCSALGNRVLFGEFLWQTHGLFYDRLPDFFIGYDLLDRTSETFLVAGVVRQELKGIVGVVPELWRGVVRTPAQLSRKIEALAALPSVFGDSAEGVYVRFERGSRLVARAKYRNLTFQAGWHDGLPKRNSLADRTDKMKPATARKNK
jgi:hypothetical protein